MATTQPLCATVFTNHPQLQDSLTLLDRLILTSAKISRTPFSYCSLGLCFHNNHLNWSLAQRKITITNQDAQNRTSFLSISYSLLPIQKQLSSPHGLVECPSELLLSSFLHILQTVSSAIVPNRPPP
jgi:hypothetical protein